MHDLFVVVGVSATALVAATIAAIAGFGGAVIMLPVLVWAFGVREAIPLLTIAQLMGNLSRVLLNRGELKLPVVKWFSVGAVPAAVLGGIVLATAPTPALTRVLGLFLLLIVAYRHTPWGKRIRISLQGFLPLGAISAFLSAIIGSAGPFMAPFFLAYGLMKGAYIGTEALATVVMHLTKLGVYEKYALLDAQIVLVGIAIGAVMFVGSWLGKRLLNRLPERFFPYIIEGVLVVAGLQFVVFG
jgi:uncharacterized membrane protein YfcA